MTSQLLDRSCGGPAHREVRTKRVPEHMHAVVLDVTTPGCPPNARPQGFSLQHLTVLFTEDQRTPEMPVLT